MRKRRCDQRRNTQVMGLASGLSAETEHGGLSRNKREPLPSWGLPYPSARSSIPLLASVEEPQATVVKLLRLFRLGWLGQRLRTLLQLCQAIWKAIL